MYLTFWCKHCHFFHNSHRWTSYIAILQWPALRCRTRFYCIIVPCTFRGWLSGKLKRGMSSPEQNTRVAWSAGRSHHSHPDWAWFSSNDQAWNILETAEKIAKKQSEYDPSRQPPTLTVDIIIAHVDCITRVIHM